jgi:hypothetical protein
MLWVPNGNGGQIRGNRPFLCEFDHLIYLLVITTRAQGWTIRPVYGPEWYTAFLVSVGDCGNRVGPPAHRRNS